MRTGIVSRKMLAMAPGRVSVRKEKLETSRDQPSLGKGKLTPQECSHDDG